MREYLMYLFFGLKRVTKVEGVCKEAQLCEPIGYWDTIEQCKKCGKIL